MKPEPVPLDLQVILIGRDYLLRLLYMYDDDFRDLFKVKAEFDSVMEVSKSNIKDLCGFLTGLCQEESLLKLTAEAMAKTIEFAHRLANHQQKLSTQIEEVADVIREAHYYAQEENSTEINSKHIHKAIEEKKYRSNLIQKKIKELIEEGVIFIDLEGEKIGQINGLSVIDIGDLSFGRPNRITATTSIGKEGIIDIEKEVKLGGPIHSKGVLILSGFLFEKFGKDKPLNLSVQLVFEQSYSGVEGDSASSAELYTILSSLAGLPIKQGIAVTGSVNQNGEVQAVGGINEKIEGYFEICKQAGLTGDQGVIIPKANSRHLMLKEDLIKSVSSGKFHIWVVETIAEGFEILTGVKSGTVTFDRDKGTLLFEAGSSFDRINSRLEQMTKVLQAFNKKEEVEN